MIFHIDMDAFYAAVEVLDNPLLAGKPVIVGGLTDRSVVSTCNYEARKYGVRSAMPIVRAKKICPQGVFLPVRMERYREISEIVMHILAKYSVQVEQISIDEAFLFISDCADLLKIGKQIKEEIKRRTGLTCSIGIGGNKLISKLATEHGKPDGLYLVGKGEEEAFLRDKPVEALWGVGKKIKEALNRLGIFQVKDLRKYEKKFLMEKFGKYGSLLYDFARGIDHRPIETNRKVKSIGRETTLDHDTANLIVLKRELFLLLQDVCKELRFCGLVTDKYRLKIKYSDFRIKTREVTLPYKTNNEITIFKTLYPRFIHLIEQGSLLRLIGVIAHGFEHQEDSLFVDTRTDSLVEILDQLQEQFGRNAIDLGLVYFTVENQ